MAVVGWALRRAVAVPSGKKLNLLLRRHTNSDNDPNQQVRLRMEQGVTILEFPASASWSRINIELRISQIAGAGFYLHSP